MEVSDHATQRDQPMLKPGQHRRPIDDGSAGAAVGDRRPAGDGRCPRAGASGPDRPVAAAGRSGAWRLAGPAGRGAAAGLLSLCADVRGSQAWNEATVRRRPLGPAPDWAAHDRTGCCEKCSDPHSAHLRKESAASALSSMDWISRSYAALSNLPLVPPLATGEVGIPPVRNETMEYFPVCRRAKYRATRQAPGAAAVSADSLVLMG